MQCSIPRYTLLPVQPGVWGLLAGLSMVPQLICFTGVAVLQARGQTRQGQARGQDRQGQARGQDRQGQARGQTRQGQARGQDRQGEARGQDRQGQDMGQDRQGHKQPEHLWYSARKQCDLGSWWEITFYIMFSNLPMNSKTGWNGDFYFSNKINISWIIIQIVTS